MANYFVKIDGTAGTGTGAHQGWLKAESFQLALQGSEVLLARNQDGASSKLFLLGSRGTIIPQVIIDAENGGKTYLRIELSNVFISGMTVVAQSSTETFTLNYLAVTFIRGINLAAAQALAGGAGGASQR